MDLRIGSLIDCPFVINSHMGMSRKKYRLRIIAEQVVEYVRGAPFAHRKIIFASPNRIDLRRMAGNKNRHFGILFCNFGERRTHPCLGFFRYSVKAVLSQIGVDIHRQKMIAVDNDVTISRLRGGKVLIERVDFRSVSVVKTFFRHASRPISVMISVRDDDSRFRRIVKLFDDGNKLFCLGFRSVLSLVAVEIERVYFIMRFYVIESSTKIIRLLLCISDMGIGHACKSQPNIRFIECLGNLHGLCGNDFSFYRFSAGTDKRTGHYPRQNDTSHLYAVFLFHNKVSLSVNSTAIPIE